MQLTSIVNRIRKLFTTVHTSGLTVMVQSQQYNGNSANRMAGGWHRIRHPVCVKRGSRLLQPQMERFAAISNGHCGHTHRHSDHCRILHAHAYHFGCETFHEHAKFQAKSKLYVGPGIGADKFLQLHYIRCVLVAICHRIVLSYHGRSK